MRMASAQPPGRAIRWPVAALVVMTALWYMPWLPALPGGASSPSWRLALAIAYERGLVFGRDIGFTFGPLGALDSWLYWPAIYWPALAFWAVLAALSAWLLLRSNADGARTSWYLAGALLLLSLTPDTALMLLPLAYCYAALHDQRRDFAWAAALICMGALVLIKATLIPLCLIAVVCGALLRDTAARRTLWLDLALLCASALTWWLMLGQPLSALPNYLAWSFEVARGYAQAMSIPARPGVAAGLALALLSALWLAWHQARSSNASPWGRLSWTGFVVFSMFIAWRHSVTRGDAEHLVIGFCYVGAIALCLLVLVPARRALGLSIMALCLIGVAIDARQVDSNFMNGSPLGRIAAWARGLVDLAHGTNPRERLDAALRSQVVLARAAHPKLTNLEGSFDILGYEHDLLLTTNTGDWRPRPIFQSYSVYTPALAALNARYLESNAAPHWLVAPLQTIDGRLPSMDDPTLWPVLRDRYHVAKIEGDVLLLERRASRQIDTDTFTAIRLDLPDWTVLPPFAASAVYARVDYAEPWWRRALGAVWQPAQYHLEYRSSPNAVAQRYRLIPEIAHDGFLLLPLLTTTAALSDWIARPDERVTSGGQLRITDAQGDPIPARITLCASIACPP